jgi:hypothetical protein
MQRWGFSSQNLNLYDCNEAYIERRGVEKHTRIERIGKNDGGLICGTPKYLHARSESNLEYAALAGSVHGGLFPVDYLSHKSRAVI